MENHKYFLYFGIIWTILFASISFYWAMGGGMDCPSCALTIAKGLNRLKDIHEAKVNYNIAKLQIVGSNALALDYVEDEVQKLGFTLLQ